MGLFDKFLGKKKEVQEVVPEVPKGMKGVFMKGIGMHWATSCKPLVEEALQNTDGINEFKVEAPPKDQAFVIYDPKKIGLDEIKKAIQESGFGVKKIEEVV